jgi:hypothetical protein
LTGSAWGCRIASGPGGRSRGSATVIFQAAVQQPQRPCCGPCRATRGRLSGCDALRARPKALVIMMCGGFAAIALANGVESWHRRSAKRTGFATHSASPTSLRKSLVGASSLTVPPSKVIALALPSRSLGRADIDPQHLRESLYARRSCGRGRRFRGEDGRCSKESAIARQFGS